eukprot:scaffold1443_cov113-Cylindrotheca_fusiformis.AAC.9
MEGRVWWMSCSMCNCAISVTPQYSHCVVKYGKQVRPSLILGLNTKRQDGRKETDLIINSSQGCWVFFGLVALHFFFRLSLTKNDNSKDKQANEHPISEIKIRRCNYGSLPDGYSPTLRVQPTLDPRKHDWTHRRRALEDRHVVEKGEGGELACKADCIEAVLYVSVNMHARECHCHAVSCNNEQFVLAAMQHRHK